MRFGTQLLSFVQDDRGVTATLLTDGSEEVHEVRASYLVAADGAGSGIRQALGIEMADRGGSLEGPLGQYVNIYFHANLGHLVEGRQFGLCFVENPESPGIILAVNNTDRWLFNVPYAPEQGATLADFGPERCAELIRAAIGLPELAVEILSVLPWEAAARIADRFQSGRVLLIGDAAHTMPSAGAFGPNTAVQDAQNVCWKLATVLGGVAEPSLLATYEVERRPLAERVVDMAMREMDAPSPDAPVGEDAEEGADPTAAETMPGQLPPVLGHQYADGALAADDPAAGTDGKPGTQAQHVWLERTGQRLSTIDLFGDHLVLLAGAAGTSWCDAARTVADRRGLPLGAHRIGTGSDLADPDASWCRAYGVSQDGAVLVRPDGAVDWRRAGAVVEPEIEIARALGALVGA